MIQKQSIHKVDPYKISQYNNHIRVKWSLSVLAEHLQDPLDVIMALGEVGIYRLVMVLAVFLPEPVGCLGLSTLSIAASLPFATTIALISAIDAFNVDTSELSSCIMCIIAFMSAAISLLDTARLVSA